MGREWNLEHVGMALISDHFNAILLSDISLYMYFFLPSLGKGERRVYVVIQDPINNVKSVYDGGMHVGIAYLFYDL